MLTGLDCEEVEEQATFTVSGAHYATWEHYSLPFSWSEGPRFASEAGECITEFVEPPPPGDGGSGGGDSNCQNYLVTIWELVDGVWEEIDSFITGVCTN